MGLFSRREDERHESGWSWSTSCKSDPRFDLSGYASGMWSAMSDIDKAIRSRAASLGIPEDQIPEDIEYVGNRL